MRTSVVAALASLVGLVVIGPACGSSSGGSGFGNNSSSGGSSGGSGGSSGGSGGSSGSGSGSLLGDGGSSGAGDGGCPVPSPENYDFPGDGCDDDGNGVADMPTVCDQSLSITGTAEDFAHAIDICQDASPTQWGIVSATYTTGYNGGALPGPGTPPANCGMTGATSTFGGDAQHGILPKFGAQMPRLGSSLGVLSSGWAREWDDTQGASTGPCTYPPTSATDFGAPCFKGFQEPMTCIGTAPPGYPKAATGCTVANAVLDAISVTLQIKVPANANGLQFDFAFYSGEWPEYVCTPFNDSFVAWLQSTAFTGNPPMSGDLNISFDAKNNPVSVNNGFFETCTSNAPTGCCANTTAMGCGAPTGTAACMNGPQGLGGTGFEDEGTYCQAPSTGGGSTGWLTTKAPVTPGETITLQFIIWDTGDPNWDSSVLVDHFTWQRGPTMTGTTVAQ